MSIQGIISNAGKLERSFRMPFQPCNFGERQDADSTDHRTDNKTALMWGTLRLRAWCRKIKQDVFGNCRSICTVMDAGTGGNHDGYEQHNRMD